MKKLFILVLVLLFLFFYPGFADERNDIYKKIGVFFTGDQSTLIVEDEVENKNKKSLLSDELDINLGIISDNKETTNVDVEEKVLSTQSTGAPAGSGLSVEEKQIWTKIWELRDLSPIQESFFSLSFNEKTRLFDVNLLGDSRREDFNTWLKLNGFEIVPEDQFVFF